MRTFRFAFALALSAVSASCSISSDHFSCDFAPSDGFDKCGDWSNVSIQYRSTIETFCRSSGAAFTTATCPSANRIGGCKATSSDGDGITWFYPSDKVATLNDVVKQCAATDMLLDPAGKEVERGNGVCSKARTEIAVLTFKNLTTSTVSLYLRDQSCVEQFKKTMLAGDISGQPTHPEDVWVVRAGDQDATGTILLEVVCEASGAIDIK